MNGDRYMASVARSQADRPRKRKEGKGRVGAMRNLGRLVSKHPVKGVERARQGEVLRGSQQGNQTTDIIGGFKVSHRSDQLL